MWKLKEDPISERFVLNMNLNWEILTPSWEIFNMLVPHWWDHFSNSHFAALSKRWQGTESLTFSIKSHLVSIIYAKLYLEGNESLLFVTSFLHQFRNYGFTRCIKKIYYLLYKPTLLRYKNILELLPYYYEVLLFYKDW